MEHRQKRNNVGRQKSLAQRRRTLARETRHCTKKTFSSWLREGVESKGEERKRLNEEANREESKSGKREVE